MSTAPLPHAAPLPNEDDVQRTLIPPPPTLLRDLPDAVAAPTAAIFGGFSKLRGKRAMHPLGLVTTARLAVPNDSQLPAAWRNLDGTTGVVRFSKGVGLPARIPDVLGIALRFGDQDLLLASAAGGAPILQHVLVPGAGFDRTVFSSLLAHRCGARVAIIHGRIPARLPRAASFLDAVRAASTPRIQLTAVGLTGTRRSLGIVTVGEVIEGEQAARLRFDPWRAGASLEPVGPIQRLRAAAYAGSRRATGH